MKTFVCNNCGAEVRRPTTPLRCTACGEQRIGLFRAAATPRPGSSPPPAGGSAAPAGTAEAVSGPPKVTATTPPAATTPRAAVAPRAPSPAPPPTSVSPKPAPPAAATRTNKPSPPATVPENKTGSRPSGGLRPGPAAAPTAKTPTAPPTKKRQDGPPAPLETAPASSRPAAASLPPAASNPTRPGDIVWRFPIQIPGQDYSAAALRNCPAVDEAGRLYTAIGRKLCALEERDGAMRVLWEYATGGQIPGSPALGGDGRLRVHSGDGMLHCVTLAGEAAWSPLAVEEPLGWSSPVVDSQGNTWICLYNGGLLRVDPRGVRSGTPFFRSRQKFDSTPLVRGDMLYVGAEDGFVYAIKLDASRGRNQWDHLAGAGKTEWFINSSPALSPQPALIVSGRDEFLYAFDFDGTQLWRLHLRGQMLASPAVTPQGEVLVGISLMRRGETGQGKLVCVDGRSHRVRWEYAANGAVESTPVVGDDGLVYFGDNSGTIHAVGADGKRSWTADVGVAARSAGTIAAAQRVVFGLDNGTLVGLLCSSRSIAAGGWPKYMGSLEQSGFVRA